MATTTNGQTPQYTKFRRNGAVTYIRTQLRKIFSTLPLCIDCSKRRDCDDYSTAVNIGASRGLALQVIACPNFEFDTKECRRG